MEVVVRRAQPVIGIVILLAAWQVLTTLGVVTPILLPPPIDVFLELGNMFATGSIWLHLEASLLRAGSGFLIACAISIPLGLAIGWSALVNRVAMPVAEVFRQIPVLAMFPVFLLFLGIGYQSQIAMVTWGAMWPILLNTISAARGVDPILIKAARSLGASELQLFTKVVLPSSVPVMTTGIRLGATYSLLVLVAAEMIGATNGLGFLILNSQYNLQIRTMYAAIIMLAILGLSLNYILLASQAWLTRWNAPTH
jgi:NitT/TauT family transport system permease protein